MGFLDNPTDNPTPDNPRDWPHDQRYAGICRRCHETTAAVTPLEADLSVTSVEPRPRFFGPKRAPLCWEHTNAATRDWWLAKFQQP